MKMDEKLNLIIPVERDEGSFWVYTLPLSREVYEQHFLVMAKAFAQMNAAGVSMLQGPKIAGLMLKKVAIEMEVWEGAGGVQQGLVSEFVRLSTVVMPSDAGYQQLPLAKVFADKMLSEDETVEVMGALCFFMLASRGYPRKSLKAIFEDVEDLWGTRISSSTITELIASLPTSTSAGNGGATGAPTP
jgi:hypothetical protein